MRNPFIKSDPTLVTLESGREMYINPLDTAIGGVSDTLLKMKTWAPTESRLFEEKIKPGSTVLDIGANIGYHSLLAASLVTVTGKVYSFEPDTTNFYFLEKNIRKNEYSNVHPYNVAVGEKLQWITLYECDENKGDHRTYDSGDGRIGVPALLTSIDELFSVKPEGIDFIKMDIQGFEYFALKGMQQTLKQNPKIQMLIEYWPFGLNKAGVDPIDLLLLLDKLGFSLQSLDEFEYRLTPLRKNQFAAFTKSLEPNEMCANLYCKRK